MNEIWDMFQIKPGDPQDINILGVDLGDGEYCSSEAVKFGIGSKIETSKHLFIDNTHNKDKDFTVYFVNQEGMEILGMEAVQHYTHNSVTEEPRVYTNFKRPPINDIAEQKYGGSFHENIPTYKELMKRTFQRIIINAFESNRGLYAKPRTVVFVGRPASQLWEQCAKAYQELLIEGLEVPGYNGEIEVVVYSEAQAALAYEYKDGHIKMDETVIIIDGGSSTFDAVIVKNGVIIGEYSRQMGAGMIEENMLDIFLLGDEKSLYAPAGSRIKRRIEKSKEITQYNYGICRLQLREKKEQYFGSQGIGGTEDNAYSIYLNGKKSRRFIDHELMDTAIKKIPVEVIDSYTISNQGIYGKREYDSFMEAVRDFFEGAKGVCIKKKAVPDKIILTGGATAMGFIKKMAKTVFGIEPIRADFPSFSVAEGLAFMGYVEFLKNQELTNLKEAVNHMIQFNYGTICECVKHSYVDIIWNTKFVKGLYKWQEDMGCKTVNDWYQKSLYGIPFDNVRRKIQLWLEKDGGLLKMIEKQLDQNFTVLFPSAPNPYQFYICSSDISAALLKANGLGKIEFSMVKLLGIWKSLFGPKWETELSKEQKAKVADSILTREHRIRKILSSQIDGQCPEAANEIQMVLIRQMDEELEQYMEGMTPYFVQCG